MEPVLAYITAKDKEEALLIGRKLLEERLAACINVFAEMHSLYWWEGKIDTSQESVLIAKTDRAKVAALKKKVEEVHSYSIPCILVIEIQGGNERYLEWLNQNLS